MRSKGPGLACEGRRGARARVRVRGRSRLAGSPPGLPAEPRGDLVRCAPAAGGGGGTRLPPDEERLSHLPQRAPRLGAQPAPSGHLGCSRAGIGELVSRTGWCHHGLVWQAGSAPLLSSWTGSCRRCSPSFFLWFFLWLGFTFSHVPFTCTCR